MDAERLVKISRDNIPVGRIFPGRPKNVATGSLIRTGRIAENKEEEI